MAGELILVIDDGQENRDFILEYVLQPFDYRTVTARDGREGLEMIARHTPDLVLLDYQMPRMNGIEMLKMMEARGIHTPVILMTFYGSEEVAVEVYRLGVRDYVKKPFSVEEMLAAIDHSLEDVRVRRERDALNDRLIAANREMKRRLTELDVLYHLGKSVTALMELDDLLPRVVDAAVKITGAEEGYLYLLTAEGFACRAAKRHNQPRALPVQGSSDDPIAAQAVKTRQPVIHAPPPANGHRNRSAPVASAAAPLMLGGQPIGALRVSNLSDTGEPFTQHAGALLSALSDYAAIAIGNARNVEALRAQKEGEKANIRSLFARFVPPQVVDQVIDAPETLQLGGVRKAVTILFADIRGYTAYAENMPPEQIVGMLNDYLSLAANVILSYGGTLDKYMGDGLMAIFNAPDDQADHLRSALDAALTLQQGAKAMEKERGDGLAFGIGVHSGEAVVGFIGTDCAMNYTAVGDAVNLAKRLQEAAKAGQIVIEATTIDALGGRAEAQPLGELKIRNRQKPALAYALVGIKA